jgi:uncharacterized protein
MATLLKDLAKVAVQGAIKVAIQGAVNVSDTDKAKGEGQELGNLPSIVQGAPRVLVRDRGDASVVHPLSGRTSTKIKATIANASAVSLQPAPIRPRWIISGYPEARGGGIAISPDYTTLVSAWSCETGSFFWRYRQNETVYVISGEAFQQNGDGTETRLGAGDVAFFPAGYECTWRVTEPLLKITVLNEPLWAPLGFLLKVWNRLLEMARNVFARITMH